VATDVTDDDETYSLIETRLIPEEGDLGELRGGRGGGHDTGGSNDSTIICSGYSEDASMAGCSYLSDLGSSVLEKLSARNSCVPPRCNSLSSSSVPSCDFSIQTPMIGSDESDSSISAPANQDEANELLAPAERESCLSQRRDSYRHSDIGSSRDPGIPGRSSPGGVVVSQSLDTETVGDVEEEGEGRIVNIPSEISQLTNTALRARLVSLGECPGPLVASTRRIHEVHLLDLIQGQHHADTSSSRGSRSLASGE